MDSDWRAKIPSLGESLGHIFDTGLYSDVGFLVGKDEFRINAHKIILSARSEPLAAMLHERWSSATEQEIKLPQNNKSAVKHFLKSLYTDIISFENVELDDILEITHLAHMYQVHKLLSQCIDHLTVNINETNCLQIYKSCQLLAKILSENALQFFLANVVPTAKFNDAYLTWDYKTLEKILLDDREHVSESILFNALLRWRNVDSARNDDFKKLIQFIRFPTMSSKDFASEVVPSGVLSKDDIVEIFSYISLQNGTVKFSTKPRKAFITAAVIDPIHLKICGDPIPVQMQAFLQTTESPEIDLHKFGFTMYCPTSPSRHPSTRATNIKLYGMKFFSSGVNNEDLLDYLLSRSFKIKVTVDGNTGGVDATVSRVIHKTIVELNQLQMRAYFDSPLVISLNETYSISTNLIPAFRVRHTIRNHFYCQLPELFSTHHQVNFDGISGHLQIQPFVGIYSLIDELLFSPPTTSADCAECKIS